MPEDFDNDHTASISSEPKSHIVDGLISVIQPVIYETDLRIVAVRQSQNELNKEIERLTAELQLFSDITDPPALQASHAKLMTARKQLAHSNQLLQSVHTRISKMQDQLKQTHQAK
ncbi:hypothetical protein INT43_000695 [Umbelopsis isabellina]|uniref:Biogenesis of lysosome-related organelles complex 1 subunit 7 n=1 Tax=Mortierella isabellina TaxID=91625 RepID=A0A8H7Q284_MORIS|nr:hypothetical protein INT43_000695 [Umbelopsis isabellina]